LPILVRGGQTSLTMRIGAGLSRTTEQHITAGKVTCFVIEKPQAFASLESC
jgi:hypothetical protein